MSYKKPNIKGPRVKMKSTRVMNEVMLRVFKNKHPEYKNLTLADFNTVVKKFNENIIEEVINSRYGVTLPERIGRLVVVAFPKAKKKIIDFGKSNKTGVLSYHANWDTDNRLGKILYQNSVKGYGIKYHKLWTFTATRTFKEKVSIAFKMLWAKYIFIDKGHTINSALK
tara:strand:+ start:59 stop:565 length:507 start_codon:yes stop_codon:yes gene_type:complete